MTTSGPAVPTTASNTVETPCWVLDLEALVAQECHQPRRRRELLVPGLGVLVHPGAECAQVGIDGGIVLFGNGLQVHWTLLGCGGPPQSSGPQPRPEEVADGPLSRSTEGHQAADQGAAPHIGEVYSGFRSDAPGAFADGALSASTKELIALAIGISDGATAASPATAARRPARAPPEEVAEMVGVTILMQGGPATIYGPRAWDAYQEFLAAELPAE